jgi:hypothetical protein
VTSFSAQFATDGDDSRRMKSRYAGWRAGTEVGFFLVR